MTSATTPGAPGSGPAFDPATLRLGFACNWAPDPRTTWSGTPWNLRAALEDHTTVVNLGPTLSPWMRTGLKAVGTRRVEGRWVTTWRHSPAWNRLAPVLLDRELARQACDAVVQIGDLAALDRPFFILQDLTYDVLLREVDDQGRVPHFPGLSVDAIRRLRDRQHAIYEKAAGVLAMSSWLAGTLVELSGLPKDRVHVVYPGATATESAPARPARPDREPQRLLFIGRDFHTKAGDVVVRAFEELRRRHRPDVTLTIAGPKAWPLATPIPEGIEFLGPVPSMGLADLYDDHDLVVMPSRLEGFGIVFVEALSRGVPCVGRNAFAMPELVTPGCNGNLVDGDDPGILAETIARTLTDGGIYDRCWQERVQVTERFTWQRSALDTLAAIGSVLG
jgi:glycosyltransferase involved in cell wall biosynthesis